MEDGEDEDGRLSSTGNRLANDILAHHGIRNAFLLDGRWLFKSAVDDRPVQFILKQEILEACAVHAGEDCCPNKRGIRYRLKTFDLRLINFFWRCHSFTL